MAKLMRSDWMRWAVTSVIVGSLAALSTPAKAAVLDDLLIRPGLDEAEYDNCARDLARGKVATPDAANACAQALRPRDLGICVDRITTRDNAISGDQALAVCRFVRRPVEAATCVVDIRRRGGDAAVIDVLDNCRRSLLPERFSKCVVDLNRELKLSTQDSIKTCIDASDRFRDLSTTTIPSASPPGITPPAPTTTTPSPTPGQTTPTPSTTTPGRSTPTPPTTTPGRTTSPTTNPGRTTPGTVTPQRG